ncbi:FUSC family protein [Frankia gtarii]|uniref:FUSC family protein n=1 Tax=Frankia gtarii TaxID=2950102 RepID=UPI0021C10C7F|nr:FUSC family protein [Frankia gtarii]
MAEVQLEVATPATPARAAERFRRGWVDRFLGSDPGLNRFRMALHCVVTIALILLVEYLFVRATHAMQVQTHGASLPAAKAAEVATINHYMQVIAMMVGALIGLISVFGVADPTPRGQLVTMLLLPVPMIPMLVLGISIADHRTISLIVIAASLAVGTYCRRFGLRGFIGGMLLFMGAFLGFFLGAAVSLDDLGWLCAEIGVGLAVALAVRFGLFFPRPAKDLRRTQRSYAARARKVAKLALELFDDPDHSERQEQRLHRQLVRLNEAALMIDAQLGDPAAVAEGSSGQLLHQRLFDVELALTNVARFAQAMTRLDLPADQLAEARGALQGLLGRDNETANTHARALIELLRAVDHDSDPLAGSSDRTAIVVAHRFAGSVLALTEAMSQWLALGSAKTEDGAARVFQPSVMLFGGWLPGSAVTSATASLERGVHSGGRIRLAPHVRAAIQMAVAVSAAIALGDLLSGRRFYWAVIAAFITFMGANNSGEQVRKAFFRVVGTLVGILIGSVLAHAVGHNTALSLAIIFISLFFGFYLMRINYAFMVVGITVMVSQLYVQLDEFSNSLLRLRLEETALGAGVAIATVMVVFPLRTRRVLRIAVRGYVEAVANLVEHASARLVADPAVGDPAVGDPASGETVLRADARAIDAAYQSLVATALPMRRNVTGGIDESVGELMRLASASRSYSRNLVHDVDRATPLDLGSRREIKGASATLHESLDVIAAALNGPRDTTYTRSSALFDRAERRSEELAGAVHDGQLAIRDLKLIDGSMARLAETMSLRIADYDTVGVG